MSSRHAQVIIGAASYTSTIPCCKGLQEQLYTQAVNLCIAFGALTCELLKWPEVTLACEASSWLGETQGTTGFRKLMKYRNIEETAPVSLAGQVIIAAGLSGHGALSCRE